MKTRVLVCGSRHYTDRARVYKVLDAAIERLDLGFLIQGGATGADAIAKEWAEDRNILNVQYDADWSVGPSGGPIRNARMLAEGKPDIVLAFPGNTGTGNMIRQAIEAGVRVIRID